MARFDGFVDSQKYDLNRKSLNTKIYIKPPDDMNLVPDQKDFLLTVSKDQSLNLTCFALVSCNDINYDITFRTNSSVSFLNNYILYIEINHEHTEHTNIVTNQFYFF